MSARLNISVDEKVLTSHLMAYTIVSDILRMQAQPVNLIAGDNNMLIFGLRANLQKQQCERLIFKEIAENLPGYTAMVDWTEKRLVVKRVNQEKRKQPAAAKKQATTGGCTDNNTD